VKYTAHIVIINLVTKDQKDRKKVSIKTNSQALAELTELRRAQHPGWQIIEIIEWSSDLARVIQS
jgi:hypothetical protein